MKKDWIEVDFKDVVDKVSTVKYKLRQKEYSEIGAFPVVDQGKELIGGYTDKEELVLKCSLPVIVFGDHTKAVKLIDFKFVPGADGTKVLLPKSIVVPSFLAFYTKILTQKIEDKGYARHYQQIESQIIFLPPLPEQRAIVSRIEELFSELDHAITNLKSAQAKLEIYRQAVLKIAFEGGFTAMISSRENWRKTTLIEISEIIGGVTKGRKLEGKKTVSVPYLRVANVQDGYLNLSEIKQINVLFTDVKKYELMQDDMLFTEGGDKDKLGRGALWNSKIPVCIHQNHIFRARILDKKQASPKYISLYGRSREAKNYFFKNAKQTTNLASINKRILSAFPIPLPEIEVQTQIVQEIESRLSVADKLAETIQTNLLKSESLRQSILKQAFEGKLLSEAELEACRKEADWEPAEKLLERIMAMKKKK